MRRSTSSRGARYIFEGTVSEANPGADQKQGGINIGGLNLGGGKNKDTIAVDVRILDANTGDVLDSISVSEVLNDSAVGIGGTAAFANTLASMSGHSASPLTPDVNYQSAHRESVDKALRACMRDLGARAHQARGPQRQRVSSKVNAAQPAPRTP